LLFVYSRVGKNRDTRRETPAGAGAGRGASHEAFLFSYPIVAPRSANDIYRPVRDSSGLIFICSEQRRTHLSTDEQVSFSTRQTATHPLKRSPTAELGCFASRSGLVLNILFVAINLSCGALASHFAARCSAGPHIDVINAHSYIFNYMSRYWP